MDSMHPQACDVVSPHLLDALAKNGDIETRQLALNTLDHSAQIRERRRSALEAKSGSTVRPAQNVPTQGIVPDQLLHQVLDSNNADATSKALAQKTLQVNQQIQDGSASKLDAIVAQPVNSVCREIYDMQNQEKKPDGSDETYKLLPGKLARSEGEASVADERVNQAYDNCAKVMQFYRQIFDYNFLDGTGPIISSVHFENGYQNASWLGDSIQQMVYGDGGGNLYNFTACLDIIGHEMTHAVIEHTCGLHYSGDSGALNEHVADVFGMLVTLWDDKKTVAQADWLIGENCLMPGIKGVALRNMKYPGTAYDDPKFGKDPQPASWAEIEAYKAKHKFWASYDHGSVHAFSGVPNRAFVLAAEACGGYPWEKAGKIWWVAMHRVPSDCAFTQFADTTVAMAEELFGNIESKAVRDAWDEVGIVSGQAAQASKT